VNSERELSTQVTSGDTEAIKRGRQRRERRPDQLKFSDFLANEEPNKTKPAEVPNNPFEAAL